LSGQFLFIAYFLQKFLLPGHQRPGGTAGFSAVDAFSGSVYMSGTIGLFVITLDKIAEFFDGLHCRWRNTIQISHAGQYAPNGLAFTDGFIEQTFNRGFD